MTPKRVTLVPHTHWDREWYLPFAGFQKRLVRMMDGLIELLDEGFPHFHLDGQTAMIDDYLEVRPEREPDIGRLVAEGKLSAGPWFTQVDEFLVSGESLIRNLERGLARAAELGGALPVGHLPDQFGHVGQMPQLLARGGIDRAVLWRGVPSAIDRTAFWWEAPDGSRVRVEYLPWGYSLGGGLREARDPAVLANVLGDMLRLLDPFAPGDRVLVLTGGDHQGPDRSLPERLAAANDFADGFRAEIGSLAGHVGIEPAEGLPVWRGELRSAHRAHLLPGVYSTRIHQKRERGGLESLVERYAEPLAALVPGFEWPAAALDRIWQLLLWNGAHDSVCGCSVDEVAQDVDARYAEARSIATGIVDDALAPLAGRVGLAGTLTFNPSPFEREGVPALGWAVVGGEAPAAQGLPLRVDGEWILGGPLALRVVDEPDVGDLYNFCPAPGAVPAVPRSVSASGDRAVVSFDGLEVRVRLTRRPGDPFVRVEGMVRNERPDHRLRLHVRLPEAVDRVIALTPFELVERGLVSEGGTETPSPTWPARGAVLASGVAVLAEGVVEYEVVGAELAVALLRCVGTISRGAMATRKWAAGPDIATPAAQMIGETEFSLGIAPNATRADLPELWERFALPLLLAPAPGGGPLPARGSLLAIDPGRAVLSSVRRREGAVQVTLWNPGEAPVDARVAGRAIRIPPAAIVAVPGS